MKLLDSHLFEMEENQKLDVFLKVWRRPYEIDAEAQICSEALIDLLTHFEIKLAETLEQLKEEIADIQADFQAVTQFQSLNETNEAAKYTQELDEKI